MVGLNGSRLQSSLCIFKLIAFFFNAKKRQVKKKIELRQNASAHADLKILQVPASFHWCDFMPLRHSAFKIKRQVSCYWKWLTLFLPIGQKNDSRKIVHLNWQKNAKCRPSLAENRILPPRVFSNHAKCQICWVLGKFQLIRNFWLLVISHYELVKKWNLNLQTNMRVCSSSWT